MELKINDRTNFGWFYSTHREITTLAAKNINNLKPHLLRLEAFSQMPDLDEKGLLHNWHFFSPLQQKSFFDFNSKSNAFAKYMEHVWAMQKAIKDKEIEKYVEHAGRAVHYLQDMTQPLHTLKGFIFNKIINLKKHMAFEGYVKRNQDNLFGLYKEKGFEDKTFEALFLNNVKASSQVKISELKYKPFWKEIGTNGINQAITSTRDFFIKFSRLIDEKK